MKKTPLYDVHKEYGGKMIDFGGWELPVQYSGIIEEHRHVRKAAGLFDVSHMGEIMVRGTDAKDFIQGMVTNDMSRADQNRAVYSPVCYPDGGTVDDLLVYGLDENTFLLVVNAANTQKDYAWFCENRKKDVSIEDVSDRFAQIAIQGPKAGKILQKLTDTELDRIRFFHLCPSVNLNGVEAIVSRTGYTGEDGFELYFKPESAKTLWDWLMEAGKQEGIMPAGLGARDTLRLEAALPLYGHELSSGISPFEAGLDRFVKLEKEPFIGKKALMEQKQSGVSRRLVGFELLERGIPRNGYEVCFKGEKVGYVTSGSFSPSLSQSIGMALVDSRYSTEGTEFEVRVRNRALKARIIKVPFVTKKTHSKPVYPEKSNT